MPRLFCLAQNKAIPGNSSAYLVYTRSQHIDSEWAARARYLFSSSSDYDNNQIDLVRRYFPLAGRSYMFLAWCLMNPTPSICNALCPISDLSYH